MRDDASGLLPQPFSIEHRTTGDGVHVLLPRGDLDLATAPRLSDAAEAVPGDAALLVVDLRGVTFLDSSGLRGVLLARRRAERDAIELLVCVDPDLHGPIFELTQLDQELPLIDGPALAARLAGR